MKPNFPTLPAAADFARQLLTNGYTRRGQWSLGQVCKHLTTTMEFSRRGFPPMKVPLPIRLLAKPALWWIFRRGMPKGVAAPEILVYGDHVDDAQAVAAFASEVNAFIDHPGPLAPSPLFGRLDRNQWTRLHLVHAQHHFGFLEPAGR